MLLALAALVLAAGGPPAPPTRADQLRAMQEEIVRLRGEMEGLRGREAGLLGELAVLDAESRLREAELGQAEARLAGAEETLRGREDRAAELTAAQAERARSLAFRLRETYKRRDAAAVLHLLLEDEPERLAEGLRAAARLSERDAALLRAFRSDAERLREETAALQAERQRAAEAREAAAAARDAVAAARRRKAALLETVRTDRARHDQAIAELETAARDLGRVLEEGRGAEPGAPALDVRAFRGLLDWPVEGRVSAGFGAAVHPRFGTKVPHNGLDLEAESGTPFRAVFDGKVVYAAWLRGYGLTAIVDHGGGVASVYAHAAALFVDRGETVIRGQAIGQVGDTGSMRGPFLYLEIREGGKPVDPRPWLRAR